MLLTTALAAAIEELGSLLLNYYISAPDKPDFVSRYCLLFSAT
jgi:hypothetical protein